MAHTTHTQWHLGVSVTYVCSDVIVTPEDIQVGGWCIHRYMNARRHVISYNKLRFSSGQVYHQMNYRSALSFQSLSHFLTVGAVLREEGLCLYLPLPW